MSTLYKFNQITLDYQPVKNRSFMHKVGLSILFFLLFIMITALKPHVPIQYVNTEPELIILDPTFEEFSEENLWNKLIELNFKHPDIVYAQAIQETGNFTSAIFKENHNLFGMKEARIRITTNKGTRRGHAYYNNWNESVLDYAMYQSRYLGKLNREQYFQYLSRNYAEDPKYVARLKQIIKRNNKK